MITIAIPTYERGAILAETLQRLTELTPRADEILVIDQTPAYPPDLEARLQSFPIRWIRLPRPSIPHAMNVALREASQPIVLFMDDDVIPSRSLVADHERAHGDGIWAVAGQVLQPGQHEQHFDRLHFDRHRSVLRDLEFPFNHDEACDVENVMAGNLSVDREKALLIGGFDENFTGAAYRFETDFARRIIVAGGRIRYEPRATLQHLHLGSGGIRAHGDHRTSASPSHTTGDYYFALTHVRPFWPYAARRFRGNVINRWLLLHPWYVPLRVVAEVRGLFEARRLYRRGRQLAD